MNTRSSSLPWPPRLRRGSGRPHTVRAGVALAAALAAAAVGVVPAQGAPDPRGPGAPSASHSLRGPVTDERFYFVMADRFSNGSTANDDGGLGADPMVSGFDPTKKGFYNGGERSTTSRVWEPPQSG